ncbi:MAG TPA: MATE family efflux transporter [Anaeromyxobacteraceae bacterium]|nr:MATE family efflux transporter [Anaeromyxobacteraceae bacterium]
MPHSAPTVREELSALGRLALPLGLAAAAQSLMGVVDTAVVGRAGAAALAGTGLGNVLFFAVTVFGMGLMMGIDPLVSQALGARDPGRARHLLWQGVWLSGAAGVALAIPLAFAPLVLVPGGIAPEVARQASGYLWARLPGLPPLLFFFAARSYLQAAGGPRAVLASAVLANVANLLLDLLLVFGGSGLGTWPGPLRAVPALGATGSGIATTLATFLQTAFLALAVRSRPAGAPFSRRPTRDELARALRVGFPVGLHMGAEVGIFALVGFLAGRLGTSALAAHQVVIAVASLSFNAAVGIGNAGSVRVGWAVGAGDTAAARRAGLVAFGAGAGFMALWGTAFLGFPGAFARAMCDDAGVIAVATPLFRVAGVFQVADGIQGVGAGVLRGAGDTRFTFAANMVGHWALGLPAALALGLVLGWGVTGLWWGLCAGLVFVATALFARFRRISSRAIAPLHAASDLGAAGEPAP